MSYKNFTWTKKVEPKCIGRPYVWTKFNSNWLKTYGGGLKNEFQLRAKGAVAYKTCPFTPQQSL